MVVYPVPATSYALLEINARKSANMDLRMVDVSGKVEYVQKLVLSQGINRVELDVSKYAVGTHFIQLFHQGKNAAYFKLQIQ